jgi:hypothetical protein
MNEIGYIKKNSENITKELTIAQIPFPRVGKNPKSFVPLVI